MRASTFALAVGAAYLGAGVLGLVPAALQPPPEGAPAVTFAVLYGELLGVFPTNLLLTAIHLCTGAWGVAAWAGALSALTYARSLALLYGVLAVMGMVPGLNTLFGLLPLHGHDIWLHAGTAALGAYFGWRREALATERRAVALDRRRRARVVATDRRGGLDDRRNGHLAT